MTDIVNAALAREMDEEAALRPTAARKIMEIDDPDDPLTRYHMYAVTEWSGGEPALIGTEHAELRWFDLADAAHIEALAIEAYRGLFTRLAAA